MRTSGAATRPLPRLPVGWAGRALVACIVSSFVAPAGADLLPSVRSRSEERKFLRAPDVPDDASLESSGAVIGQVRYLRLNVFDPTIAEEDTSLFRLANRIHIVTRASTVAAQLLFRPGDRYDARLLSESERILRANDYLADAHIRPVAYRDGVVDIEVVTQDTWTLKPEVSFGRKGGKNSSGVGLEERNLFGTGTQLAVTSKSSVDRHTKLLEFSNPNLLESRWQLAAQYADNSDGKAHAFNLERPFYALDSRWTAGIELRNERRIDSVYDYGRIIDRFQTHERVETAYAGWSAGLHEGWVTRWTGGVTSDERHASPPADANTAGPLPPDRKLVYPWVGIEVVEDDFRETRNLNQISRTEDLALGWDAKLRVGAATSAFGSDRDATVFDASVSKGFEPDERQTLLLSGSATGRIAHGAFDDSLFGVAARYYWRQTSRRALFLGLAVDRGVHLDLDRQLTLGGDNGLRGYPLRYRTGQGRWLFTAEERVFTDWYPFRLFNIGGAVFYDMGRTWGANSVQVPPPPTSKQGGVLSDVGVGLRLGNSRSAIGSVVHVDVSHPINGDPSIRKFQFTVEAKRSF